MYQAVIVDDEPYIVAGLEKAIDWNGFQLEIGCATTDPQAALEYILTNPVSVIITDVSMPVLNGLQLIQKIKEVKPSVYIIVLSAYDNFEYARTALRYGAENYLLKPLDPDELSDTISQIISHLQERDQLNSTYGRAMLTFRNAFTEQWVKNLLTNNELYTKSELLGINLDATNFTVIIFSCPCRSLQQPETVMSRFFEFFLQYLPGHYTGNFFFETPTRLVGVLSAVEEENIHSFLRKIIHVAAASDICIFASVGSTVDHYADVHLSYHQADSLAFLEYTQMPYVFHEQNEDLWSAAGQALADYDSCQGQNDNAIKQLYQRYHPFQSSVAVLSYRINHLCKNEYELLNKYPELAEALAGLPSASENTSVFYVFVKQFLKNSDSLLVRVKQSMYPCVDAVIKAVHEFSDKEISLKTLSAKLNVTPSYLGTVFHQQTGYYFNDYLAEARLKYAAELLENTDLKIKDIVDKIGFASQTYFNRSFKRYYDTSPVNYRRDKKVNSL